MILGLDLSVLSSGLWSAGSQLLLGILIFLMFVLAIPWLVLLYKLGPVSDRDAARDARLKEEERRLNA